MKVICKICKKRKVFPHGYFWIEEKDMIEHFKEKHPIIYKRELEKGDEE